jgi:hypothetical protein
MESISPTVSRFSKSSSNPIWSRVVSTFALAVMAGVLVACGAGLAGQGGPRIAQDRSKITGNALLTDNQAEAAGYGLYSYVLFESPPTTETKPIYLAVILACLKEFPDLEGLAKKYRPELLNAMYIPVTGDTADFKTPTLEQPEQNPMKSKAEEILQRYNYGRAQTILTQLAKIQRNGGPYLVSSLKPTSSDRGTSPFVLQDLSVVRLASNQEDQKKMAYEWVLDFVDRVSNPQSAAWNRATLENFGDELREARQPTFKRYGVRADSLELKKYIVFTMPDGKVEQTAPSPVWRSEGGDVGPNRYSVVAQSRPVPRRVSFPSQTAPTHQREKACDGRCQGRG